MLSRLSLAPRGAEWHFPATPGSRSGHCRERKLEMRDELDGRMWVAHHEQLSQSVDDAVIAVRAALARFAAWDGTTHQLLALVAAFAVTGLSIGSTSGAA
jgi:hypothetical protein